jgi:hypothetical protein
MKMKNGLAVATAFNNEKFRPPFCSMAYTDSVKTYLNRITFRFPFRCLHRNL